MRGLSFALLLAFHAPLFAENPVTKTAEALILPSDARLVSLGRMDKSAPKAWRFDWSATSICFKFKGTDFALQLENGGSDFNVWVDGSLKTIWRTSIADKRYEVNALEKGVHTVQVQRRNEPSYGVSVFKGLLLPRGGQLLPPGKTWTRKHKLEFCGASWTCGYGNEGAGLTCSDLRPVENADLAFPAYVSRMLDAESMSIAYSGKGLVRNYGEKAQTSPEPFGAFYGRALYGDPASVWDYKSWTPDAVVVNLGGNDYSTEPRPDTEVFVRAQVDLLKRLRDQYPKALQVCFVSGEWPNYLPYIEEAITRRREAGDKNVHVLVYQDFKPEELGCDYHPKAWGHRRLAEQLAPWLKKKLGW